MCARKNEWYEDQAAQAPWRGTVNGKEAYIDRFKGQWEVCCRVDKGGTGVMMFQLTNREAIRRLAKAASPSIPEELQRKMMGGANRDVPVRAPRASWGKRVAVLALIAIAAAAAAWFYQPELFAQLRALLPK